VAALSLSNCEFVLFVLVNHLFFCLAGQSEKEVFLRRTCSSRVIEINHNIYHRQLSQDLLPRFSS